MIDNNESISLKTFPHPSLRKKALPFEDFSAVELIVENMLSVMYANSGIGLAANQVGLLKRIFVMDLSEHKTNPRVIINPEIIQLSDKKQTLDEGCLSLPGLWHKVTRPSSVILRYLDIKQKVQEEEFLGLASTCVQHEIDHLDAILFPDRLLPIKQVGVWKKYIASIKKISNT